MNAYAERFVRSIKHECLNRIVPLGENHLRTAVRSYVTHYHLERNHQGLDNRLTTRKESEFERLRGAFCSFDKTRMSQQDRSARRKSSSHGRSLLRHPLPFGKESPRSRQQVDLRSSRQSRHRREYPVSGAYWRDSPILLSGGGVSGTPRFSRQPNAAEGALRDLALEGTRL